MFQGKKLTLTFFSKKTWHLLVFLHRIKQQPEGAHKIQNFKWHPLGHCIIEGMCLSFLGRNGSGGGAKSDHL